MSNSDNSIVPRDSFYIEVSKELSAHPYSQSFYGLVNPYTRREIFSQREYEEYIRESVFHRMCEEAVASKVSNLHAQLLSAGNDKIALSRSVSTYKRRFRQLLAVAAALILAFFAFILPNSKDAAFSLGVDVGFEDGYSSGKSDGFTAGYAEGEDFGYRDGHADGRTEGHSDGYSAGYKSGTSTRHPSTPSYSQPSHSQPSSPSSSGSGLRQALPGTKVYVSNYGKIHLRSNCSGMKHYSTMTYDAAYNAGYSHCSKCF